jgi:uncharacterized ParB-like nuclease family protein
MNKVMNVGALVLDERLQSRTEINEATVAEYAENIKAGDDFPPVLIYFDGISYYLTDGYHRYHAHKRAEKVSILCEVVHGTFRDATLHATGVNSKHGMRRTHADKRKAVMTLLDDFEWSLWSNAEIARHCSVSPTFVANLRDSGGPAEVKYKTSGGNIATKARAPGRVAKATESKQPELKAPEVEYKRDEQEQEAINVILAENEELKARVAVVAMDATEEEKQAAGELIAELREELRVANIELTAVKQSRDQFQLENQQLKSQCASYQRQIKKLQG